MKFELPQDAQEDKTVKIAHPDVNQHLISLIKNAWFESRLVAD